MRIINREEFLNMPKDTLFCTFSDGAFGELMVKKETKGNDWYECDMKQPDCNNSEEYNELIAMSSESGKSFKLSLFDESRNGLYDDNSQYAVYEDDDMRQLLRIIKKCYMAVPLDFPKG